MILQTLAEHLRHTHGLTAQAHELGIDVLDRTGQPRHHLVLEDTRLTVFTVGNPHATIDLNDPDALDQLDRSIARIPKDPR